MCVCVCVWSFVLVVWRQWWFFLGQHKGFGIFHIGCLSIDLYLLLGCKILIPIAKCLQKKTNIWIHLEYHTIWPYFIIYIYGTVALNRCVLCFFLFSNRTFETKTLGDFCQDEPHSHFVKALVTGLNQTWWAELIVKNVWHYEMPLKIDPNSRVAHPRGVRNKQTSSCFFLKLKEYTVKKSSLRDK